MNLFASMMLTVDGVYQGPGCPDEDRRGGFERGGWISSGVRLQTYRPVGRATFGNAGE